ncbi:MAG TPA: hypothetical protein VG345_07705 [Bryobacteraceae bacterium]|nr:hypothetical protein [Bryobacteraceae bacterium]
MALCGCSSEPAKKAEEKKPAEPVTGLHALYQMYTAARAWAQDLQVLSLRSIHIDQVKDQPGKSGAWQAQFASPSLGKARAYTFSAVEVSMTMHEGVSPDSPRDWTNNGMSFLVGAAKIDSDQAWNTALEHAKDFAARNPNEPISYTLQMERGFVNPEWRVIWGSSAATSSYSVLVDAFTGAFTTVLH